MLLGVVVSTAISGCQPPAAPSPKPGVKSSNTTDGVAPVKPEKPAVDPAQPADKKRKDNPTSEQPKRPSDKAASRAVKVADREPRAA